MPTVTRYPTLDRMFIAEAEEFADARNASTATSMPNPSDTLGVAMLPASNWSIWRSGLVFDTSDVGTDAHSVTASLSLYGASPHTGSIVAVSFTPSSTSSFALSDYGQFGSSVCSGAIDGANWNTSGGNSFSIAATAINRSGPTCIGLRDYKGDYANNSTNFGVIAFYAAEKGSAYRPTLTVTYSDIADLPPITTYIEYVFAGPVSGAWENALYAADKNDATYASLVGGSGVMRATDIAKTVFVGTITKVWVVFLYSCAGSHTADWSATAVFRWRPLFGGTTPGPWNDCLPQLAQSMVAQWIDVTNVTGAPSSWSANDVTFLDIEIEGTTNGSLEYRVYGVKLSVVSTVVAAEDNSDCVVFGAPPRFRRKVYPVPC